MASPASSVQPAHYFRQQPTSLAAIPLRTYAAITPLRPESLSLATALTKTRAQLMRARLISTPAVILARRTTLLLTHCSEISEPTANRRLIPSDSSASHSMRPSWPTAGGLVQSLAWSWAQDFNMACPFTRKLTTLLISIPHFTTRLWL